LTAEPLALRHFLQGQTVIDPGSPWIAWRTAPNGQLPACRQAIRRKV